jgi:hypothetical protein
MYIELLTGNAAGISLRRAQVPPTHVVAILSWIAQLHLSTALRRLAATAAYA